MTQKTEKSHETAHERALREAGLAVVAHHAVGGGRLYELRAGGQPGPRLFLAEQPERGTALGLRLELPEGSGLAGLAAGSEPALTLLGALTYALQPQGLEAHLLHGPSGLEAIIVEARLASGPVTAEQLKAALARIRLLADALPQALAGKGPAAVAALLSASGPRHGGLAPRAHQHEVAVAPTFDLAERDRMRQRLEKSRSRK